MQSKLPPPSLPLTCPNLGARSYGVVAAYGLADTTSRGMHAYTAACGDAATTTTTTTGCSSGSAAAAVPLATRTAGAFADSARELAGACSDCLAPGCAVASSAAEPHSAAVPVPAAVLDSVLWHGAASLVIPGVLINRAVWASGRLLERLPRAPPRLRAAGPSALGLALIPIAVPHIDEGVTRWMDSHVRPHLGTGQVGTGVPAWHCLALLLRCVLLVVGAASLVPIGALPSAQNEPLLPRPGPRSAACRTASSHVGRAACEATQRMHQGRSKRTPPSPTCRHASPFRQDRTAASPLAA